MSNKRALFTNNSGDQKIIHEYVRAVILEMKKKNTLRIFDFDDTLVASDAHVYVTNRLGKTFKLNPGEYAVYQPAFGDTFDYRDFDTLIRPREIKWTGDILRKIYRKNGPKGIQILTARRNARPIEEFLDDAGLSGIKVIALGSNDPNDKARWIASQIEQFDLHRVEFFDDSIKNIRAVRKMMRAYPDVNIIVRHIVQRVHNGNVHHANRGI